MDGGSPCCSCVGEGTVFTNPRLRLYRWGETKEVWLLGLEYYTGKVITCVLLQDLGHIPLSGWPSQVRRDLNHNPTETLVPLSPDISNLQPTAGMFETGHSTSGRVGSAG